MDNVKFLRAIKIQANKFSSKAISCGQFQEYNANQGIWRRTIYYFY